MSKIETEIEFVRHIERVYFAEKVALVEARDTTIRREVFRQAAANCLGALDSFECRDRLLRLAEK